MAMKVNEAVKSLWLHIEHTNPHDETILTRTFHILHTTNALMSVTNLILDPIVANFDAQYDDILLDANNHAM